MLGGQRQDAADHLGDQYNHHQRHAHNGSHLYGDPVDDQKLDKITQRQGHTAHGSHADLLPDCPECLFEFNLAQGNTSDDRDAGLRSGITAGIHQHGDVGGQDHVFGERTLRACDDGSGKCRRDHQEQEPGHSGFIGLQNTCLKIRPVRRQDSCHLFDILCGLFLDDIDDIIDRDDTDHPVLVVHNRHRGKIVFLESHRGFLLVGRGIDADDVFIHHLADDRVGVCHDQVTQSHCTQQDALGIQNVTDIDRLCIKTDLPDSFNGIPYCHALLEIYILDRHNAAGRILRIAEQMVDVRARIGAGITQNLLDDIGRHLLEEIGRIIRHQIVDDAGSFFIGK